MLRKRYRRIVFFFARVTLGVIFHDLILARLGLRGRVERTRPERMRKIAVRFRALAIDMGGVMIKVGQFMSTRVDVLPDEIVNELAGLQDEVPPVPFEEMKPLAEAELGAALTDLFATFDETPLAAASLGQVHRATLKVETVFSTIKPSNKHPLASANLKENPDVGEPVPFKEVVVKIQRPMIDRIVATDLAALRTVSRWLKRYKPLSKRADVPALTEEFARSLHEEIDYLAEGCFAERFNRFFADDPGVRVPRVIWSFTTEKVLTLEDVYAIKITDYEAITAAGIDRGEVAKRLLDTYLKQIFEDGFFHADPHPGNLFVEPCEDGEWLLTFVDFGMVGIVPTQMKAGLREMLIGVATQDPGRVVRSYELLGVMLPGADMRELERAETQIFERFWGKTMTELQDISFSEMEEFAYEFKDLLYELPFQIPRDLIWLGRTVAILSGMCMGLDPAFNVWDGIAPFTETLIKNETLKGWDFVKNEVVDLARLAVGMPRRIDAVLKLMETGQLEVQDPGRTRQLNRLNGILMRLVGAVFFAAFLFSGVQLYLGDEVSLAWVFFGLAALAFGWTAWGRHNR